MHDVSVLEKLTKHIATGRHIHWWKLIALTSSLGDVMLNVTFGALFPSKFVLPLSFLGHRYIIITPKLFVTFFV